MLLAGDIGGTKIDLALISRDGGPAAPVARMELPSADHPSLAAAVRYFLDSVRQPVELASLAVAGPVVGGRANLTNLSWTLEERVLARELGVGSVHLMNDLEAIAHAIPTLDRADLHTLNVGRAVPGGALAVIAPGTGLGEALLVWDGARYRAFPSEGGHSDFAPATERQVGLLAHLLRRFDHVSVERVCSGIGLRNIYEYLRDAGLVGAEAALDARLRTAADPNPVIAEGALRTPADPLSAATVDEFVAILAQQAANLALTVLSTGGVYIAGGILPRLLTIVDAKRFMTSFLRKGRMAGLLREMPVHVVTTRAALRGAAIRGLELWDAARPAAASRSAR